MIISIGIHQCEIDYLNLDIPNFDIFLYGEFFHLIEDSHIEARGYIQPEYRDISTGYCPINKGDILIAPADCSYQDITKLVKLGVRVILLKEEKYKCFEIYEDLNPHG